MRPTTFHVGGVVYWVLHTRDPDTMVLKDADSDPTVAVRKNGASVGDSVTVTKRSATTGIYDCSYNPASEVEGDSFTLEETATVTGTTTASATYKSSFTVRVLALERGTDSAALASGVNVTQLGGSSQSLTDLKDFADDGYDPTTNKVAGVLLVDTLTTYTGNTPQTGDSYSIVSHVTHGNSALKTLTDTLTGYVDTEVAAIKAKTDNLPSYPADQSAVEAAITAATSPLATAANLSTVAGYLDTEIAAILADTNELQTDWANGGRLDNILDARASQASVDDLRNLEVVFEGTVINAGAASIQFATSGYVDNHFRDMLVVFESGDADGECSPILTNRIVNGSLDAIDFAENLAVTPSVGSTFTIRTKHIHSVTTIQSGLATQTSVDNIPTNAELATALAAADDAVLAAISALNNLSAAQVNAELLDVLSVDTFAELSAPPAASSSLKDKLVWLFMWARNKATQSATERKLYADNGTTVVSTETVSDASGTFTKGEAS